MDYASIMSLDQLKERVATLEPREQRELIAYILALQTAKDAEFKSLLAKKIDDSDPSHWVDLDELKKRFSD